MHGPRAGHTSGASVQKVLLLSKVDNKGCQLHTHSTCSAMGRNSGQRGRKSKPDKKQQRKKQKALMERCLQALNQNAAEFREKLAGGEALKQTSDGGSGAELDGASRPLTHFQPVRINCLTKETLSDAVDMLSEKFTLDEGEERVRKGN
ncbi:hypothetical protein SprV_0702433700 [Sparganum proliferum]